MRTIASEKEIENSILEYLNFIPGCIAFKLTVSGVFDSKKRIFRPAGKHVPKGGPDIIFCFNGRFGAFEVKSAAGYKKFHNHPGEHELRQKAYLERIRKKGGGFAEVVNSFEHAKELFEAFTRHTGH